jgi:hypothetical protein
VVPVPVPVPVLLDVLSLVFGDVVLGDVVLERSVELELDVELESARRIVPLELSDVFVVSPDPFMPAQPVSAKPIAAARAIQF